MSPWDQEQVDTFRAWIDEGCPPGSAATALTEIDGLDDTKMARSGEDIGDRELALDSRERGMAWRKRHGDPGWG